jgi:subtilisin family serine protease
MIGSSRRTLANLTRCMGALALSNLVACADATSPVRRMAPTKPAASLEGVIKPDSVFNRWVVVFRPGLVASAAEPSAALVAQTGGLRFYVYETALKGFAVANLPDAGIAILRSNPLVLLLEQDQVVYPAQAVQNFSYPADTGLYLLDRIDQLNLPLDFRYTYDRSGTGVNIYIVDSGIRGGHEQWGYGRIGLSAAFIMWSDNPSPTIDQLGHGTKVAGAAAGNVIGVAKTATLHSVRIDDGDAGAHESDIIAGLDWIAGHRQMPAVTNLSYANLPPGVAQAVQGLMQHGVTFVHVAGNIYWADACNSITQIEGVITVGATDRSDRRASYSSNGTCVDLFAPGGDVFGYSTGSGLVKLAFNDGAYTYDKGTSFAAPLATGVAALVLQQNSTLSPTAVQNILNNSATGGVVYNNGTSPNRLLYSRIQVQAPPQVPSISISGPSAIASPGEYTWLGVVSGTGDPYTVTWDKSLDDGATWSSVGEGDNYSTYEGTGGPHNLVFRATLLTSGQTATSTDHWVYVDTSCGGEIC